MNDEWTVRRIIDWTTAHLKKHGSETPRLDTEILLAHARGCRRIELYTRFDDVLSERERTAMRDLVRRRAQSEPVAYLVGHREFFGLDFRVTPAILIPRPDTETLVLELLDVAKPLAAPRILDVGTGSGCIAVAAAVNHPTAQVTATDVSDAALAVARENAQSHHVLDRIRFLPGDLFGPVGQNEPFDVVVSNPPYIAEHEKETLQNDVRRYEPRMRALLRTDGPGTAISTDRRSAESFDRGRNADAGDFARTVAGRCRSDGIERPLRGGSRGQGSSRAGPRRPRYISRRYISRMRAVGYAPAQRSSRNARRAPKSYAEA